MKVTPDNVKEVLAVLAPVGIRWTEGLGIFQVSCEGVEIHDGRCSLLSPWGGGETLEDALMDYFYRLAEVLEPEYVVRTLVMVPGAESYRLRYRWNGVGFAFETTEVDGYTVTVCLDDEGPFWEAYYWSIRRTGDGVTCISGWSGTVPEARKESVDAAKNRLTADQEGVKVNP